MGGGVGQGVAGAGAGVREPPTSSALTHRPFLDVRGCFHLSFPSSFNFNYIVARTLTVRSTLSTDHQVYRTVPLAYILTVSYSQSPELTHLAQLKLRSH